MPSTVDVPSLPSSDSPTLALLHPTPEENLATTKVNGMSWRGPLCLEAYIRRERHLASQALTRDGGITFWILVDTSKTSTPRTVLASCETVRKRALIRRQNGRVEETVAHGIASVFCNPDLRGRGYAWRMIQELGKALDTWQHAEGKIADFTILFSDIGKKFYSKHGWKPFPSSHMALSPVAQQEPDSQVPSRLPATAPLYADDLPDLCRADEATLKNRIATSTLQVVSAVLVALIPDLQTLQWHHAREEFVAKELSDKLPEVKGAIVRGQEGSRVWSIWTRTFGNEEDGHTLNILRIVIEGEEDFERQTLGQEPSMSSLGPSDQHRVLAAASVLQAARQEAAAWIMNDVQIWNPTTLATLAVKHLYPSATLIHRDAESIASLRWRSPSMYPAIDVQWIGNEKYGWC